MKTAVLNSIGCAAISNVVLLIGQPSFTRILCTSLIYLHGNALLFWYTPSTQEELHCCWLFDDSHPVVLRMAMDVGAMAASPAPQMPNE